MPTHTYMPAYTYAYPSLQHVHDLLLRDELDAGSLSTLALLLAALSPGLGLLGPTAARGLAWLTGEHHCVLQ